MERSRLKTKGVPLQRSAPSDQEYRNAVEQYVDAILDPRRPWLKEFILVFGFPKIPTQWQIESGALAAKMREAISADYFVDEALFLALEQRDRKALITTFTKIAKARQLTHDELERLLLSVDSKELKKSIKALGDPFKTPPGPVPPTAGQYDHALKLSDDLHLLLLRLLQEQATGTTNTTQDIIQFIAKDFPGTVGLVIENLALLEDVLQDRHLQGKAKKTRTRARVLADALAGAVHLKLMPSTAREYLRAERYRRSRVRDKAAKTSPANS